MVMGRNGYGPILSWAEMVMGRNDQLPSVRFFEYMTEKVFVVYLTKLKQYSVLFDFFTLDTCLEQ